LNEKRKGSEPFTTKKPFARLNPRQKKRFQELNPDFVPRRRDTPTARAKKEKAANALEKRDAKEPQNKKKHVLDWIPQPQADRVEAQQDQATQPAESNDAPVTGSAQELPSKPKRPSRLNLKSNSNVVEEILRAGRARESNPAASNSVSSKSTSQIEKNSAGKDSAGKVSAENQGGEKETLGHVARHVVIKECGSVSSPALQLTGEFLPSFGTRNQANMFD
jgi:hypothetical protein